MRTDREGGDDHPVADVTGKRNRRKGEVQIPCGEVRAEGQAQPRQGKGTQCEEETDRGTHGDGVASRCEDGDGSRGSRFPGAKPRVQEG